MPSSQQKNKSSIELSKYALRWSLIHFTRIIQVIQGGDEIQYFGFLVQIIGVSVLGMSGRLSFRHFSKYQFINLEPVITCGDLLRWYQKKIFSSRLNASI